ncbi:MAG: glycosyltransferase family 4 protein [Spirochaetaceae bacterium]|jgi:glycosyltransferase involved in cell wall biosynthesis|nr:glycosyltransferase family 4 protein [Spirochaetaceae bacterium]
MKLYINLSNLINVSFVTGIQRVVLEVVSRMIRQNYEVVLFAYDDRTQRFCVLNNEKFLTYYLNKQGAISGIIKANEALDLADIESWAVYFDCDAVWNNVVSNTEIYSRLKKYGIRIVTYVYDIVPVLYPQFSYSGTVFNFLRYISAVLMYSDLIMVSTEASKDDILNIGKRLGLENLNIEIVPLAGDFRKNESKTIESVRPETIRTVKNSSPYILCVGTIEPRKNYRLILEAFDKGFAEIGMSLIILGRTGWESDDIVERIQKHPKLGKTLFLIQDSNDSELTYYYKNAFALGLPSFYEGFGLPVIEALNIGTPVISSDVDVLREVGQGYAVYFENNNPDSFLTKVKYLIANPEEYSKIKTRISSFKSTSWDEVVDNINKKLSSLDKNFSPSPKISTDQVFLLTNREENALNAIEFIETLMVFINKIVITCPQHTKSKILENYQGQLKLVFLTDEFLLGGRQLPKDHQTRNFYLRALAVEHLEIQEYFIMYDDDYRPLIPVREAFFITENRINAHYYYDLELWKGDPYQKTSFDKGAKKTFSLLNSLSYPTLSYASHMPQLICKSIWQKMIEAIPDITDCGCDEWSMFFNYGIKNYPHMFNRVKYKTLSWPGKPSDWENYVEPDEYVFENFYNGFYKRDGIFSGLSEKITESYLEETPKKIGIQSQLKLEYDKAKEVRNTYEKFYQETDKEFPGFAVKLDRNGTGTFIHPKYIILKQTDKNAQNSLALKISVSFIAENNFVKSLSASLFCGLVDNSDSRIFWQDTYSVDFSDPDNIAQLIVFSPNYNLNCSLRLGFKSVNPKAKLFCTVPLYLV